MPLTQAGQYKALPIRAPSHSTPTTVIMTNIHLETNMTMIYLLTQGRAPIRAPPPLTADTPNTVIMTKISKHDIY